MKTSMIKLKRTAAICLFLGLFAVLVHAESQKEAHKQEAAKKAAQKSVQEAAKKVKKLQLEPWEAWDKYRDQMITISRQLGVTCTHCHDTKNYRDASKRTHQIAKAHMEMVDMINEKYKQSFSEKVDCYMCHKGVVKPDFKEKKDKF